MAVVTDNNLIRGISGMVGNSMIFKTWNGKTFVYAKPRLPQKESLKQKETRSKFKDATVFAKSMMSDPVKKVEYSQKAKKLNLPNAYTAAITEYMRKPEVKAADLSKYTGKPGEVIEVSVVKKGFEVEAVEIELLDENGEVIEGGKAINKGKIEWIYKTTSTLQDQKVFTLLIRTRERTGNCIEKRLPLAI